MIKPPKNQFLDEYEKSNNKSELRKEAFPYFNEKYYKNPFVPNWIFDQEERKLARKLNFFLPGRIYTFQYLPYNTDELDFYDTRPIIYVIGEYISKSTEMRTVQGINLNFLPEKAKVLFLNSIFNAFGRAYEKAEKISEQQRISFMPEVQRFLTNWTFMKGILDTQNKIGIDFAVRNYHVKKIMNPVLIESDDYEMIPYFVPRELEGKPPAFVYRLYLQSKNVLAKKKKPVKNNLVFKKR